jgi:hypothetical protein
LANIHPVNVDTDVIAEFIGATLYQTLTTGFTAALLVVCTLEISEIRMGDVDLLLTLKEIPPENTSVAVCEVATTICALLSK